jgi:hypothetical protein
VDPAGALSSPDRVAPSTPIGSGSGPGGNVAGALSALSTLGTLLDPVSTPGATSHVSSPTAPPLPAPSPNSGIGIGSSSSTGFFFGFAALFLLIVWTVARLTCRLVSRSALQRPTPFLSLLEQPG